MADDRIYISEPEGDYWEWAISQDGTFGTIGPWQTGPNNRSFASLPNGDPFVLDQNYTFYGRDEDENRRNPGGYDAVVVVKFAPDGDSGGSSSIVSLQIATNNGRFTDDTINAGGYQSPEFPMVDETNVLMTVKKVLVTRPNGQQVLEEEIVKIDSEKVVGGTAPVAPVIEDQSVIVDKDFEFQWPEFERAINYSVSGLPAGVTVIDPSPSGRKLGGKIPAAGSWEITITGYGPTGKPTAVSFTLTAVAAQPRYIQEYYGTPVGSGARFNLKGFGGDDGIRLRIKDSTGTNTLLDTLWTYDPGKWDLPSPATGKADYTYLLPTLANGTYLVEAQLVSSSTVYSATYTHTSGGDGKKIFPSTINLILNKPNIVLASGGISPVGANDGNVDDDTVIAGGELSALEITLFENTRKPKVEFIRIFPADDDTDSRQSIADNYLITGSGIGRAVTLAENLNAPDTKNVKLASSIPADPFIDIPWDNQEYEKLVFQGGSGTKYIKEIEVYGTRPVNPPPVQVTAIAPIRLTEGDTGKVGLAGNFSDPGDTLSYGGILNDNVATPEWLDVDPVTGEVLWANVPFEGLPTESETYYPFNLIVVDTGGSQLIVAIPVYVKRKNAIPTWLKYVNFRLDINTLSLTPQFEVADGSNYALNLRGLSNDIKSYAQLGKSTQSGSYTTEDAPQHAYNRLGQPFTAITLNRTYEAEIYKTANPADNYKVPVVVPPGGGNQDIVVYGGSSGTGESITNVYGDDVLLDEEHKSTIRSVASGAVNLRVAKVGGGYDTGYQPGVKPSGKDYYEYTNSTVLADGDYIRYSQLVSDPSVVVTSNFTVKTEVKRLTIYPTNVTNGVMYGIGIAARTSPKTLTLQILKPVDPFASGGNTMNNDAGQYTGTDDTHRYNYGSTPPTNTYDFENPHEYKFRIGTSGPWVSTNPYARNGDGVGVRRDVYPIPTSSSQPGQLLSDDTTTWILTETWSE